MAHVEGGAVGDIDPPAIPYYTNLITYNIIHSTNSEYLIAEHWNGHPIDHTVPEETESDFYLNTQWLNVKKKKKKLSSITSSSHFNMGASMIWGNTTSAFHKH